MASALLLRHPESLVGAVLLAAMVPFAGGHTIDARQLPHIKKFIDAGRPK